MKTITFTAFLVTAAVVATVAVHLITPFLLDPFIKPASPLDKSIVKQFVYDIDATYPPIVGLDVDLYNLIGIIDTQTTNASGHVTFDQLVDETYTLKWMWGGVEAQEQIQVTCDQIVWELPTNYLQSKSGGGTKKWWDM